jgi:anti-sigma regulatory factor (Ser/Thr protein kinase)
MAVVVVRTSEVDLASWEGQFSAEPIRVSEARRLAHETFLSWGMDTEQADLACLLVSEVVTNVVLHATTSPTPRHELVLEGAGPGPMGILGDWEIASFDEALSSAPGKDFTLRLRRGHEAIWVEVFDNDLRLPRIRSAGESDEGGRGLYLVDQLASRWGSRPTKDGKAVWFEVPIKGSLGPSGR